MGRTIHLYNVDLLNPKCFEKGADKGRCRILIWKDDMDCVDKVVGSVRRAYRNHGDLFVNDDGDPLELFEVPRPLYDGDYFTGSKLYEGRCYIEAAENGLKFNYDRAAQTTPADVIIYVYTYYKDRKWRIGFKLINAKPITA